MANFECDACGKSHRVYDKWVECQTRVSKTKCVCPNFWRAKREAGLWSSHSPDCPLRDKEAA